jgi:hypothetical protein
MARLFTLDEAQATLPEARQRVALIHAMVADLERLVDQLAAGVAPASAHEEVAALEHGVEASLAWFEANAIQIKQLAPILLDFPARATRDGTVIDVLLCWRDDEDAIAYFHPVDDGYRGRAPVALLDRV